MYGVHEKNLSWLKRWCITGFHFTNVSFIRGFHSTNLSYKHNISNLFSNANHELNKINNSFKASRLLLNLLKTKYSLFHKSSISDDLPLRLPA